jgi:16S rRNA pseudouridine516 synthase
MRNDSERLDAYLAHRGYGSRSETRDLVRRGFVTVDGKVCTDAGAHVAAEDVRVRGETVETAATAATLVMHKPVGYACSHDERESPLVEELIEPSLRHLALETAGRLDRDTSGLLIVTTDGDLIHALTNPRRKLVKRYRITYSGKLSHHAVQRCAKGMTLDDDPRPLLPAKLVITDHGDISHATLFLSEGRYHQVRRMIAALGGTVVTLHRDRVGSLTLPNDLEPGKSRELTARELELLLTSDELPVA